MARSSEPLLVVLEPDHELEGLAAFLPPGSLVVTPAERPPTRSVDLTGIETVAITGALPALRAILRHRTTDVLLVSDPEKLTHGVIHALREGLTADSACATVSLQEGSRPFARDLPPPGAIRPRAGVVLARRDHLILALDDAEPGTDGEHGRGCRGDDGGVVGNALGVLARPGFLHRVASPCGPSPPRPPAVTAAAHRAHVTDIALDGRCLGHPLSGTQTQFLGLAMGLARMGARPTVMLPHEVHPSVASAVDRMGNDLPCVERSRLRQAAIFHRPFQMWSLEDLADCLSLGERLVLTHQDMILDRTPEYTSTMERWHAYKEATRAALSSADEVGFFSRHAAEDAASDGLVDCARSTVVPLGVDHLSRDERVTPANPFGGRPYMLVLGNSYWHKNRVFAVRLLRWLIEGEGWDGGLVLAGGDTTLGSSVSAEAALVGASPPLRGRVIDRGIVTEAEREALYRGAELVLFPSMYEGFGLVPFEAATFGTACAYTYRASMREYLPDAGAFPSFDVDEAGPFVSTLLGDNAARSRVLAEITKAAASLTWERTARGYLDAYGRAHEREPRRVSRSIVGVDPPDRRRVTETEARLLDAFGRRRGVRHAVEGVFAAVDAARAVRARLGRPR